MTIWINNPFDFLPGEGARLQRYGLLSQALAQAGHRVIWWSSDWNHVRKVGREVLKFESAKVLKLERENIEHSTSSFTNTASTYAKATVDETEDRSNIEQGLEIRLIRTMPYAKNVSVRRLMSHWLYAREWKKMALACVKEGDAKPDLILCSAPPLSTGWVMRDLCKHFGCPGVVDVMDLWPETFERVAPKWLLWPLRWMAKRVYQGADGISAVGDSYLEAVERQLQSAVAVGSGEERAPRQGAAVPSGKPMFRCYHGIGEVLKCESSKVLKLGETTADLKLAYVGNMGRGYDLETLVRAVMELRDEGCSIGLDLAGGGEQEPALHALAQTKKEAICFHGVVTGEPLRDLLAQADVGVVPMFPNTHVAVPYKLADYVASGLPVINSLPGETSALLAQYGCGWSYEAGSVASLKQALKAVCELKQGEAAAFEARGRNARRLAEECFDAARIYPAFVRWIIATTKWSQ